jgi:hypothetical protein
MSAASGAAEAQLHRPAAADAVQSSADTVGQLQSGSLLRSGSHGHEPAAPAPDLGDTADSSARIADEQDSAKAASSGLVALRPDLFGLGGLVQQTAEQPLQLQQQQEGDLASAAAVVRAVIAGPIATQHACVSWACLG